MSTKKHTKKPAQPSGSPEVVSIGSKRFEFDWDDGKAVLWHCVIVLSCAVPWIILHFYKPDFAGPATAAVASAAGSAVVKLITEYVSDHTKG